MLVPKKLDRSTGTKRHFEQQLQTLPDNSLNMQMMAMTRSRRFTGLLKMEGMLDQFLMMMMELNALRP